MTAVLLPLCVALKSLELFQLIKCTSSVIIFPGTGALRRVLIALLLWSKFI